jgi:LCP family protein required for cell wall assembly
MIAIALLGTVAMVGGKLWHTLKVFGDPKGALNPIVALKDPRGQFPDKANRINILLLGVDYSYLWVKGNVALNGARYTKESRSDTIMMLSLDMDTQKVSALSIPRDTWVTDPTGHRGKINGAFKRGGPTLAARTVAELLGVTPDYYVAVKPDAVKSVIDELGGVQVETIDAMKYDDAAAGLHIDLPAGPQTINGEQAIGFARFREADTVLRDANGNGIPTGRKDSEGNPIFRRKRPSEVIHSEEEGDERRMARQQQLIRAVAEKGKQPVNWLKADRIIEAGLKHIDTNLSPTQMLALAALFKGLQTNEMQTATLEGRGLAPRGGTYRFIPDERKKQAMVDWLLKGDETAARRLTAVAVQNGTGTPGLARRVAALLRDQGFDAQSTGNADGTVGATRIVYGKAAVAPRVEQIRRLIGGGQAVKEPRPDTKGKEDTAPDVTIILGPDVAQALGTKAASLSMPEEERVAQTP